MRKAVHALLTASVIGLVLNLLWENIQAPLYAGYTSFIQHVPICSMASLGDVAIILFLYILFALILRNVLWFQNLNTMSVFSLLIIGAVIGAGIEKWALLTSRWSYGYNMPIIPFLRVGLAPVLQMMIVPTLTFYFSSRYKGL